MKTMRCNSFDRVFLPLALLLLCGCATTPKTFSTADPNVDFNQYRTFGFLDKLSTDNEEYESMVTNFLKVAVAQEMSLRGLDYAPDPQLQVNFYIHTKEKIRSRSVPTTSAYYGYRNPYYGGMGGYGTAYETQVTQYTEGTLNIDVVDAQSRKIVWEGTAVGRITDEVLNNLEEKIDGAVKIIFKEFPIQPPVPQN